MRYFSIITICRNNLEGLKATYQSIINQESRDYQWVVVDGNSQDGTKEWLSSLSGIEWISENDEGIYDAMNKGISMANGKFMIFMNSGDCFASADVLSKSLEKIKKKDNPVFVFGDSIDISETGEQFYRKAKNYRRNWSGMITQHQAMFFNRMELESLTYDNTFPLSGDYAFISKAIKELSDSQILKLNFPICNFSMGGVNESKRFQAIKEDFKIRKEIIGVPSISNALLYLMHFVHAIIKKSIPSARFLKHKTSKK